MIRDRSQPFSGLHQIKCAAYPGLPERNPGLTLPNAFSFTAKPRWLRYCRPQKERFDCQPKTEKLLESLKRSRLFLHDPFGCRYDRFRRFIRHKINAPLFCVILINSNRNRTPGITRRTWRSQRQSSIKLTLLSIRLQKAAPGTAIRNNVDYFILRYFDTGGPKGMLRLPFNPK